MDYRQLFRHCISVEEREGCLIPRRYEASAIEKFTRDGHPGSFYGPGCSGITLDFSTNADEIAFRCSVLNDLSYGRMEHFDVWEDGLYTASIEWDGFAPFRYRRRKRECSRVTIYLPILYELAFSDFSLGSWLPVEPEEKKLLVIGDSIAQGLRGAYPSMGISVSIARALGMDYLNTAVGGEYHRGDITDTLPDYAPDRIFLHLGTNDVNRLDPEDISMLRIRACYDAIRRRWPGVPVDAVTPVWRTEFANGSQLGRKRLAWADMTRDQMMQAGAEAGFTIHDGMRLSPNARTALADHCHPNDLGFMLYTQNLLRELS